MQYVLLIYGSEAADNEFMESATEEQMGAWMGEWFAYSEALKGAGAFVAGEALQPTPTAATINFESGSPVVTDGPFAETKEQLGGFYLIDVDSVEKAQEWAKKMPHGDTYKVEVRPVMTFE